MDENMPPSKDLTFLQWLVQYIGSAKLKRIGIFLVIFLLSLPVITHYYVGKLGDYDVSRSKSSSLLDGDVKLKLNNENEENLAEANELKERIKELKKIKASVSNELKELEQKRHRLHSDISGFNSHIDKLKDDYREKMQKLDVLRQRIDNTRAEREEIVRRNLPEIKPPLESILNSFSNTVNNDMEDLKMKFIRKCKMYNCFDYSKCSIFSKFPVYFYPTKDIGDLHPFIEKSFKQVIKDNSYITNNGDTACIYFVLIPDMDGSTLNNRLKKLKYWNKNGANHVLLYLARHHNSPNIFNNINTGRAILAQASYYEDFRENFDVILPPTSNKILSNSWEILPYISPARRKYLMTFEGNMDAKGFNIDFEYKVIKELKNLEIQYPEQKFLFKFSCSKSLVSKDGLEWNLCNTDNERFNILENSTFSLILTSLNDSLVSTSIFQTRLLESVRAGAVPIILGGNFRFPLEEVIDWRRCVVVLPKERASELHYIIRSMTDEELLEKRRFGRHVWQIYLSSVQSILDSLFLLLRRRLNIPSNPVIDEKSKSFFNETFKKLTEESIEDEEVVDPIELPFASDKFTRNFTQITYLSTQEVDLDPFHLYPFTPRRLTLPAEATFLGSSLGFRPINGGLGGAGKEFAQALGGDFAREQFTAVLLTFERDSVLMDAIRRLKNVAHLNKVVVVWNSLKPPHIQLRWPDIGVPVHVVKTAKNSLNNRFLPYDVIETEAILSIDDDAHLRPDEINFAFRVWRQSRDRIVGFPGRFHSWDAKHNSWMYNSNYSCELSMVLTGAAFFHKYYAYLYSRIMPQAIRDKVDEYMNCEDLAMNFLVSHITRKPPIKVTSRWTFRCPGCPSALSEDETHFQERHLCMNFLTQIYGYMPLLRTQYRVDSVLFKTRIPHDKEKCYKFV
ncbi:DgyrCDS3884 [Dimorphilus gyrociliatus]|uniref:glucuronosyl-galactosyl-proteoglycan 4-alpha-N-acetylglucosaminyltransferase n=1 Tax=Dimorphilus gyrociliatus TaxID=2664684 RepID=A0A7I8VHV1_9ANNE|nr:DgyrCDS3884 [Dimorphilus gyrociliatus]